MSSQMLLLWRRARNSIHHALPEDGWRGVLPWLQRGGWALVDQGLFSGANFLVNILLARWLSPEAYGAFAVTMSIFYLLAGFHTAIITEPMMVFGAGKYREHFRKYLGVLLYGHWAISMLIAGGLGGAAWVMSRIGSVALANALTGLAIASPFLLSLWLTRRACYVPMRPSWAAAGSGVNFLIVLGSVLYLWRTEHLNALSSVMLLGVGAMTAALFLKLALKPKVRGRQGNPTVGVVALDHWRYGGWNMVAFAAYWASGQILLLLVPVFLGLTASAAVAAVWNLFRPVSLFMQSLSLILLPLFSRWVSAGMPTAEIQRRGARFAALFGGGVLLYGLLLTMAAKPVLHLLYAGKYDVYWFLVGLFGLSTAASIVASIFIMLLKARGELRLVAGVWGLSATLVVIFSVPLLVIFGLAGALLGFSMSYIVTAVRAFVKFKAQAI